LPSKWRTVLVERASEESKPQSRVSVESLAIGRGEFRFKQPVCQYYDSLSRQ